MQDEAFREQQEEPQEELQEPQEEPQEEPPAPQRRSLRRRRPFQQ